MKHRFSVAVVLAFVLAGCASSGVNKGDFNLISIQDEWALGNQLQADIAKQMRLDNDPNELAYLRAMGQRLVSKTELANMPWTFDIVDDPEVNAFSIPGGHVYVNRGLIAAADKEDELAGVLAHEINHVVARHATEQLSKQYGIQVLGSLVLGQNPAVYQQILASVIAGGAMARFSRADEKEADDLAVKTMYDAGYDPNGMVTMFQELLSREKSQPGAVDQFFASHPLTSERIADVQKQIAKLPPRSGLEHDSPEYQAFRRSVAQ